MGRRSHPCGKNDRQEKSDRYFSSLDWERSLPLIVAIAPKDATETKFRQLSCLVGH
ncbi:MAG: hypothetical protein ACYT04_34550 [Nostoc sp.]